MSPRPFPQYPEMIDEHAARVVAGFIALTGTLALATWNFWWMAALVPGFVARATVGPRFSVFALLARRAVLPLLGLAPHPTWSTPKRFAQGVGVAFSAGATAAAFVAHAPIVAAGLTATLVACAALESATGLCVGCRVYSVLAVAWEQFRVWNHSRKAQAARARA